MLCQRPTIVSPCGKLADNFSSSMTPSGASAPMCTDGRLQKCSHLAIEFVAPTRTIGAWQIHWCKTCCWAFDRLTDQSSSGLLASVGTGGVPWISQRNHRFMQHSRSVLLPSTQWQQLQMKQWQYGGSADFLAACVLLTIPQYVLLLVNHHLVKPKRLLMGDRFPRRRADFVPPYALFVDRSREGGTRSEYRMRFYADHALKCRSFATSHFVVVVRRYLFFFILESVSSRQFCAATHR